MKIQDQRKIMTVPAKIFRHGNLFYFFEFSSLNLYTLCALTNSLIPVE